MAQPRAVPAARAVSFNRFPALVCMVMAPGIVVTAWVAAFVGSNSALVKQILYTPWFAFGLFMLQTVIVVWLGAAVVRMTLGVALPGSAR